MTDWCRVVFPQYAGQPRAHGTPHTRVSSCQFPLSSLCSFRDSALRLYAPVQRLRYLRVRQNLLWGAHSGLSWAESFTLGHRLVRRSKDWCVVQKNCFILPNTDNINPQYLVATYRRVRCDHPQPSPAASQLTSPIPPYSCTKIVPPHRPRVHTRKMPSTPPHPHVPGLPYKPRGPDPLTVVWPFMPNAGLGFSTPLPRHCLYSTKVFVTRC